MMFTELELENILIGARKSISDGQCFFRPDSNDFHEQFIALKVNDSQNIWAIVLGLLEEIKPKDYLPPIRPPNILEGGVYRFVWKSQKMKKNMEIQFALSKEIFYYFSLRSKPSNRKLKT